MNAMHSIRRRGATRVFQILLIVLILLFIGAMLWPVTTDHQGGMSVRCLSSLKQLGTASAMYMADYDERLMDRDSWMDAIVPYHKNKDLEHCPAVQEQEKNPSLHGYAFNSKLSLADATKFKDPTKVEMLYESVNLGRNASDPVTSLPNPPRLHNNKRRNAMAYLDSHVRVLKPPSTP